MTPPKIIDASADIGEDVDGLHVKNEQFIPQSFLDDIRDERENSIQTPVGEMYRVARIPAAVINKWDREGFDYNRAPVEEILRKLRIDQLDAFITTNKRF